MARFVPVDLFRWGDSMGEVRVRGQPSPLLLLVSEGVGLPSIVLLLLLCGAFPRPSPRPNIARLLRRRTDRMEATEDLRNEKTFAGEVLLSLAELVGWQ